MELNLGLQYVEAIAVGARDKWGHAFKTMVDAGLDADKLQDEIGLQKLTDIFHEHNDISFAIEAEMDRRWKPMLGNKFGAKTLMNTGMEIDKKLAEVLKESKPKSEKPNLQVK